MYQQINLYQPVFRQQSKVFSAITLLSMLAVVAVFLLGLCVHSSWTLGGLNNTAASLDIQYQQLNAQFAEIETKRKSATQSPLESEIFQLQHRIDGHQELLGKFDRVAIRTSPGFGKFFEALTLQNLPGLWITGLRLTDDGLTEVRGTTLNPSLVPRYLQEMPDSPRFKSLQSGSVHLARDDTGSTEIDFVLRSKPREKTL